MEKVDIKMDEFLLVSDLVTEFEGRSVADNIHLPYNIALLAAQAAASVMIAYAVGMQREIEKETEDE